MTARNEQSQQARDQLDKWIELERTLYADVKFADDEENRTKLIAELQRGNHEVWTQFAFQYLDRVNLMGLNSRNGRQALGKAVITLHHLLETAIMLFGDMPQPGVPSGEFQVWQEVKPDAE